MVRPRSARPVLGLILAMGCSSTPESPSLTEFAIIERDSSTEFSIQLFGGYLVESESESDLRDLQYVFSNVLRLVQALAPGEGLLLACLVHPGDNVHLVTPDSNRVWIRRSGNDLIESVRIGPENTVLRYNPPLGLFFSDFYNLLFSLDSTTEYLVIAKTKIVREEEPE